MSKGNLFLGLASGKIGSVVLYRAFGEERARSWVSQKRNPRTYRQAVQRCVMKTVQGFYSSFLSLCRDSFQGYGAGTPSQAAFVSANCRLLRGRIAADVEAGRQAVLESVVGNFAGMASTLPVYNRLQLSDGGLSPIEFSVGGGGLSVAVAGADSSLTYAQFCTALGCGRGDVLDFVFAAVDAATAIITAVEHCRVVLEPAGGDMSAPLVADGRISQPAEGNFGRLSVSVPEGGGSVEFRAPFAAVAGAIVRSRQFGELRQLSPSFLEVSGAPAFLDAAPLGAAVASYMKQYGGVYLDGQ